MERNQNVRLTDEEMDTIATRAKDKALAEIYGQIGKGVVTKLLWLAGTSLIGLSAYLTAKGWINP